MNAVAQVDGVELRIVGHKEPGGLCLPAGIRTRRGRMDEKGKLILYLDVVRHGRRYAHSLETTDLKEAVKRRNKELEMIEAGWHAGKIEEVAAILGGRQKKVEVKEATIGQLLERYEQVVRRRGKPGFSTARNNMSSLRLILRRALNVEDVDKLGVSALAAETLERFAVRSQALGIEDRSIASTIVQARAVLKRRFVDEYTELALPDMARFLRYQAVEVTPFEKPQFSAEEIAILRSGRELRESNRRLYPVWFLGYYLALRAGEMAQIHAGLLREHTVTDSQRESGAWLKDRAKVWVLDLSEAGLRLKTAASAGFVPVADDVAEEFRRIATEGTEDAEGRRFLIEGKTEGARQDLIGREFAAWMRGKGWKRNKTAHELRGLRTQIWREKYDETIAESWSRHSLGKVSRHYVSRLNISRRPLGMEE